MKLNELLDNPGAGKKRKRVGRGIGSGKGKTGGRGGGPSPRCRNIKASSSLRAHSAVIRKSSTPFPAAGDSREGGPPGSGHNR